MCYLSHAHVLLFIQITILTCRKRHTFSGINTILPEHADLEEALDREDNRDTSQNLPFLETVRTKTSHSIFIGQHLASFISTNTHC